MNRKCHVCGKPVLNMNAPHKGSERPVKIWYCSLGCKWADEDSDEERNSMIWERVE